jgi:hypothetical protein
MRTEGTFTVESFTPAALEPAPMEVATAVPAEVAGSFNFTHSATTTGNDRVAEHFVVVPGSGTDGLAGITGAGGMAVDDDGTHHIWFDYDL